MGANHIDLLRTRPLWHEDLTADPGPCAVGGDSVARVAAGILHDLLHADGLAVRDQRGGSAILKGQRRHEIVHFEQHVVIQTDDRRHALAHADAAPALVVQRQKAPVAEQAPFIPVYLRKIEFRRLICKPPQPAAGTVGCARGHGLFPSAFGADEFHNASSLFIHAVPQLLRLGHGCFHPRFPLASSR